MLKINEIHRNCLIFLFLCSDALKNKKLTKIYFNSTLMSFFIDHTSVLLWIVMQTFT